MITRRVRIQLAVFAVLTVTAFSMIFFHYAKIPSLMGIGQTQVSAQFGEGAGLYPQANVTYRGVTVGKVTDVRLASPGVIADLRFDSDADIPADVDAVVKSVSAIGEQYVDLVPRSTGGERLQSGDLIPLERTRVPHEIASVLDDVDTLLSSVPLGSLSTVLDEAEQGFVGLGPDLARLNRNTQALIEEADAAYPETHLLIRDAEPVLDSQIATSPQIRAWTKQLSGFAAELRQNDEVIRAVLQDVPPAAEQVSGLLDDLSQPLPALLETADVTSDLLAAYNAPLKQVLTVYPMIAATNIANQAPSRGGQFRLAFKTIANYPGGCSEGWPTADEPLGSRPASDLEDMDFPEGAYCQIAQSDQRVARGTRNLQCFEPASPPGRRAATIQQCRGAGYTADPAPYHHIPIENPLAPVGNVLLDHLSGATESGTPTKEKSWKSLLLAPLGR